MTKTLTLDEALKYRNRKKSKWPNWVMLLSAVGWFGLAFIGPKWPVSVVIWFVCTLIAIVALLFDTILDRKRERYWDALRAVSQRCNYRRYEQAQALYENCEEALLALWECEEAHMPGDCPLCGAV